MKEWIKSDKQIRVEASTCSELALCYKAASQWVVKYEFDRSNLTWPYPSLVNVLRKEEGRLKDADFVVIVTDLFDPEGGKRLSRSELKKVIGDLLDDQEDSGDDDDSDAADEDQNHDIGQVVGTKKASASVKKAPEKTKKKIQQTKNAGKAKGRKTPLLELFDVSVDLLKRTDAQLSKIDTHTRIAAHRLAKSDPNFRMKLRSLFKRWAGHFENIQEQSELIGNQFNIWYGYEIDMPADWGVNHSHGYQPLVAEPSDS